MSSFSAYSSTVLSASQTVANFEAVGKGHRLPLGGANLAETTSVYDLGSSSAKWSSVYVNGIASSVTFSGPVTFTGRATFNTTTTFSGGAIGAPQFMAIAYVTPTGTPTVSTPTATGHICPWNTVTTNLISGASLTTDQITLPAGTYLVQWNGGYVPVFVGTVASSFYLFNATASTTVSNVGIQDSYANNAGAYVRTYSDKIYFTLATQSALEFRMLLDVAAPVIWYDGSSSYQDSQTSNISQMAVFTRVS